MSRRKWPAAGFHGRCRACRARLFTINADTAAAWLAGHAEHTGAHVWEVRPLPFPTWLAEVATGRRPASPAPLADAIRQAEARPSLDELRALAAAERARLSDAGTVHRDDT